MEKHACIINNRVVEIVEILDENDYQQFAAKYPTVLKIEHLVPQPQVGWVLNGLELEPASLENLSPEQLDTFQQTAQRQFGQKLLPDLIDKMGSRNLQLSRQFGNIDVASIASQMASIKLLLETGALKTARSVCLMIAPGFPQHEDILQYGANKITDLIKMKLYYAFSKNNKIGSKLIRWFSGLLLKKLDNIPSHVALIVESDNLVMVYESAVFAGVRVVPLESWLSFNEICYVFPEKKVQKNVASIIASSWSKGYDYLGVLYFVVAFLNKKLFNKPFPDRNRWSSENRYFCTEIVAKLTGYKNHEMATPAKMCYDLLKLREAENVNK